MAHQDDGFLREVEEELRRERLEKIWRQYGTYILIVAALIVFGVLGYKYWENSRMVAAQSMGARYEGALHLLSEGKEASAAKEFETLALYGASGYAALARLQLAGALLKEGKKSEALAAYEALANDRGADPMLKSYGALQAAALRLGEADFTEMQNRLNDLTADTSPWRYSARELLGLAALRAGRTEEARKTFEQLLADQRTPPSILERARIAMTSVVAADLVKPAAGAETGAAAGEAPKGGAAAAGPANK
jgi:hypothetical protein